MTSLRMKLRVIRRTLRTTNLRRFRRFGVRLEIFRMIRTYAYDIKAPWKQSVARIYHPMVRKWLKREYADVIEKWRDPSAITPAPAKMQLEDRARIWAMWYQGMDGAPEGVRQCIASQQRGHGGAEYTVLDGDSILRYLDIDPVLKQKVDAGTYTLTKLANYLRLSLLYDYGGLWLDSTIWMNRGMDSLSDMAFGHPFFSCRYCDSPDSSRASFGLWTTFALGCSPHSPIVGFARDMQLAYFQREDLLIDYVLFDYSLSVGYECFPWFRELVNAVPINNVNMYRLAEGLEQGDREKVKQAFADENQWFYKTTYKVGWKLYPEDVLGEG